MSPIMQEFVQGGWLAAAILAMLLIMAFAEVWHEKQRNSNTQDRYWWVLQATNMYVFEYFIDGDEAMLSDQCAKLLRLPNHMYQFSWIMERTRDKKMRRGLRCIQQVIHAEPDKVMQIEFTRATGEHAVFRAQNHEFRSSQGHLISIVGLLADVTQEVSQEKALRSRAELDGLTGIYNSGTIRCLVETGLHDHPEGRGAFVMLDLDHFKGINDTYGHQTGDKVLRHLVKALQEVTRSTDMLGRLGGDEFCIYLPEIPDEAFLDGFCIRLNKAARHMLTPSRVGCQGTISVGGVMIHPHEDFQSVYSRVDQALYEAKARGRDTHSIMP